MTQAEADGYCGPGAHYRDYGCVPITCQPGQELDLGTGSCLAKQDVDRIAQNMGVEVGAGQKLGCPPGLVLVVENSQNASCVPADSACARDEVWNGQVCVKVMQCAPGWIYDAAQHVCVAVSTDDNDYTVDLQAWTWASYGNPGADGASAFCSGFNKKPRTFGVPEGSAIHVLVDIQVQSPNRSVAQSQVLTHARVESSGAAIGPQGAAEIQRAAQDLLITLTVQAGKANTESSQTSVRCRIVNAASPAPVPETGGF